MDGYLKVRKLGEGSYGSAYLVKCKSDGKQYVSKEIRMGNKSLKEKEDARREVSLLAQLSHPSIVAYIASFEDSSSLHILMEYCDGGDLYSRIVAQKGQLFSEEQVISWFAQLALAVKHCHDRKILHRDIKSQNVFLTSSNQLKLGDFGIAKALDNTFSLARTCIGTPYYLSPEICENRSYNNKSDIWALGCVLYEIAALRHAFEGNSMQNLIVQILRGRAPTLPTRYSPDLRQLVSDIFQRNPRDRPSINKILKRPFVNRRLSSILGEAKYSEEFSHTVLHGLQLKRKLAPHNGPGPLQQAATPISGIGGHPQIFKMPPAPALKRPSSAAGLQNAAPPAARVQNPQAAAGFGLAVGPDPKKGRPAGVGNAQVRPVAGAVYQRPVSANAAGEYRRAPAPTPVSGNALANPKSNAQFLQQQAAKLGGLIERQRIARENAAREAGWKGLIDSSEKERAERDRLIAAPDAVRISNEKKEKERARAAGGNDPYAHYLQFLEKGRQEQAARDRELSELNAVLRNGGANLPAGGFGQANKGAGGGNLIVQQVGMGINRQFMNQKPPSAAPNQAAGAGEYDRRREPEINRQRFPDPPQPVPSRAVPLQKEQLNFFNAGAGAAPAEIQLDRDQFDSESNYLAQLRRIRMQNLFERREIQARRRAEEQLGVRAALGLHQARLDQLRAQAADEKARRSDNEPSTARPSEQQVQKPTDRPKTADSAKVAAKPTPSLTAAFEAIGVQPAGPKYDIKVTRGGDENEGGNARQVDVSGFVNSNANLMSLDAMSEAQKTAMQKKKQSILKRLNNKKDAVPTSEDDANSRGRWQAPAAVNIMQNRWVAPGQSFAIKESTFVIDDPESGSEQAQAQTKEPRKAWQADPSSTVLQNLRNFELETMQGTIMDAPVVDSAPAKREVIIDDVSKDSDAASASEPARSTAETKSEETAVAPATSANESKTRKLLEQTELVDEKDADEAVDAACAPTEKSEIEPTEKAASEEMEVHDEDDGTTIGSDLSNSKQMAFALSTGRFDVAEPKLLRTCSLPQLNDTVNEAVSVSRNRCDSVDSICVLIDEDLASRVNAVSIHGAEEESEAKAATLTDQLSPAPTVPATENEADSGVQKKEATEDEEGAAKDRSNDSAGTFNELASDDVDGDDLQNVQESLKHILCVTSQSEEDALAPLISSPTPTQSRNESTNEIDSTSSLVVSDGDSRDATDRVEDDEEEDEYFEEDHSESAASVGTIFSQIEQLKVDFERQLGLDLFLDVYRAFQTLIGGGSGADIQASLDDASDGGSAEHRRNKHILQLLNGDVDKYDHILQLIVTETASIS